MFSAIPVRRQVASLRRPHDTVATLEIVTQPEDDVTSGVDFTISVRALDANGILCTGDPGAVTVAIQTGPQAGTLSGPATVPLAAGIATFSVSLDKAGTYGLRCSYGAVTVDLAPVTVVAGPPAEVAVITWPEGPAFVGIPFMVAVAIRDAAGNPVTTVEGSVTVSKATGPGTLGGTLTQPLNEGVATFSNLTLDTPGEYTLTFAWGELTTTSESLQVIFAQD